MTSIATGALGPEMAAGRHGAAVREPVKPAGATPDKSTARAFEAMPIRYWNAWLDGSKPHVFVQPIEGGAAEDWFAGTKLAAASGSTARSPARARPARCSPCGRRGGEEIVFVAATNRDAMMREEVPSRLFRMKRGQEPVAVGLRHTTSPNRRFRATDGCWSCGTGKPATAKQPYTLTRLARFDWPSAPRRRC